MSLTSEQLSHLKYKVQTEIEHLESEILEAQDRISQLRDIYARAKKRFSKLRPAAAALELSSDSDSDLADPRPPSKKLRRNPTVVDLDKIPDDPCSSK